VKDLLRNKSRDDDDDDDKIKNPPYAYRMWSIINGIPVVINGVFEDGELITSVYYDQFAISKDGDGEAKNEEFGRVLAEIICPYETEELSKEDAKYIQKTLWAVYIFDRRSKQFIHGDDYEEDDEDDEDDNEKSNFDNDTQTTMLGQILYYLVDDALYNIVTNEYVRPYKTV
jgi:hypothetical protein